MDKTTLVANLTAAKAAAKAAKLALLAQKDALDAQDIASRQATLDALNEIPGLKAKLTYGGISEEFSLEAAIMGTEKRTFQVPNWRKEGEVLDRTITPKLDIMTVRRLKNAVDAIKGILADEHKTRNSSPAPEVAELVADAPVVAKPRKSRAKKVVEIA